MRCYHCGEDVNENDVFCKYCGTRIKHVTYYCANCGKEIQSIDSLCLHCGYQNRDQRQRYSVKSRIVAGILGIFVGGLGIHNFYLGYSSKGFIQLLCTFLGPLTLGISSLVAGIWGFVEGIMILAGYIKKDGNDLYIK